MELQKEIIEPVMIGEVTLLSDYFSLTMYTIKPNRNSEIYCLIYIQMA